MEKDRYNSDADKECVDGIIMGIDDSFRLLFDKYYSGLVLFANSYLNDREASEDVVQSIFVDLWDNRAQLSSDKSIKSYLFVSVKHRALNFLKQSSVSKRETISDYSDNLITYSPEFIIEDNIGETIDCAIDKLPPKCKEIFLLSKRRNLTSREIAEQLGISKRTVDTQLVKALKVLRSELKHVFISVLVLIFMMFKVA